MSRWAEAGAADPRKPARPDQTPGPFTVGDEVMHGIYQERRPDNDGRVQMMVVCNGRSIMAPWRQLALSAEEIPLCSIWNWLRAEPPSSDVGIALARTTRNEPLPLALWPIRAVLDDRLAYAEVQVLAADARSLTGDLDHLLAESACGPLKVASCVESGSENMIIRVGRTELVAELWDIDTLAAIWEAALVGYPALAERECWALTSGFHGEFRRA